MPNRFASGKYAIAQCDRCNFRFKLKELRIQVLKTRPYEVKVCKSCWDPDQPQLQLGMYPVDDPQAVRNPRPDTTYLQGGLNGLQIVDTDSANEDAIGVPTMGSRVIQWGWNPVGLNNVLDIPDIENNLVAQGQVGTVTVTTT